jgi:hypothetical protein
MVQPLPLRVSVHENKNHAHVMFCLNRFKNVIFEISPTEEVGDFEVKAKFMGVQMETFMLHYQVGRHQVEPELSGGAVLSSGRGGDSRPPRWESSERFYLKLCLEPPLN